MNDETVGRIIEMHENRLNDHDKKLDELMLSQTAADGRITSVCDKLGSLIKVLYAITAALFTAGLSLLTYMIQHTLHL